MKKTGFIAIVGRPNVGKSTLMNHLLQDHIAITSSKPQTTRNRILGILTRGDDQFVFMDTPGIHKPKTKLGKYMIQSVRLAIGGADAILLMADAGFGPGEIELSVIDQIKKLKMPSMLVLNKIDLYKRETIAETIAKYAEIHPFDAVVPVSAEKEKNLSDVLEEAEKFLSENDWFFPEDMTTDQPERQIVSETIREKLLRCLTDEIPHGTAVVIESFDESDPDLLRLRATIYCERESHKRIIIGKNGEMIKKVGTYAREDLEAFFGVKVFLDLWVKVKDNWRDSDFSLSNFGYNKKDLQD